MGQRFLNGWRQPKGGRWKLETPKLDSLVPPTPIFKYGALALLTVIAIALVPSWAPLVLFGLVQSLPGIGTLPDDHTGDPLRTGGQKLRSYLSGYSKTYFAGWYAYTGTNEVSCRLNGREAIRSRNVSSRISTVGLNIVHIPPTL